MTSVLIWKHKCSDKKELDAEKSILTFLRFS